MGGAAGKVALVNATTGVACNGGSTACSASQLASIVDLVGYGTANFFEGAAATPALTNTTAALRAGGGCVDTNNNGIRDSGEAPIAGVTVILKDAGGQPTGATAITNAQGYYEFTGLRPGTYGVAKCNRSSTSTASIRQAPQAARRRTPAT